MFVTAHAVFRELEVVARSGTDDERKAPRVGAVFFYHVQRINDIAERFRHFSALPVAHESVQVDIFERDLAAQERAHEYHACDPEEKNVISRFKHRRRVVIRQIVFRSGLALRSALRGVGPPERRKGP